MHAFDSRQLTALVFHDILYVKHKCDHNQCQHKFRSAVATQRNVRSENGHEHEIRGSPAVYR
jgi:hypothetical protein